jgi:hypothetical protein
LDAKPVASTWGSQDFDDKAESAWGFSLTDIYIDSNNVVSTISSKGYSKYCYETLPATDLRYMSSCTTKYYVSCTTSSLWLINSSTKTYVKKGANGRCYNSVRAYGDDANCDGSGIDLWTSDITSSCSATGSDVWYK